MRRDPTDIGAKSHACGADSPPTERKELRRPVLTIATSTTPPARKSPADGEFKTNPTRKDQIMPLIRVTSPENSFTAEQKAQLAPLLVDAVMVEEVDPVTE